MAKLSTAQRVAIRHFAETADPKGIAKPTIVWLVKWGYLTSAEGRPGYGLTRAGVTAHREIMSSGDGPEGLKELLRF